MQAVALRSRAVRGRQPSDGGKRHQVAPLGDRDGLELIFTVDRADELAVSISKLDAHTDQCAHVGIILRPAGSQEALSDALLPNALAHPGGRSLVETVIELRQV
jgi:hypothetical protein